MNQKLKLILADGLILFVISSIIAIGIQQSIKAVKKKGAEDDPIVTAVLQGNTDDVARLAKAGVKQTNMVDDFGRTSLMRAAYVNFADPEQTAEADKKRPPMVTLLLNEGAALNAKDHDGWTALMWASWSGLAKVADTLLERGADIAVADKMGNTALIIAARRGNVEVVKSLLAKGADKSVRNMASLTALEAAELGLKEHPKTFYEGRQEAYQQTISALR